MVLVYSMASTAQLLLKLRIHKGHTIQTLRVEWQSPQNICSKFREKTFTGWGGSNIEVYPITTRRAASTVVCGDAPVTQRSKVDI